MRPKKTEPDGPALRPSPFLDWKSDAICNPLTLASIPAPSPLSKALSSLHETRGAGPFDPDDLEVLKNGGFLSPEGLDLSRRFLLRFASIETHTLCNHACFYCPVTLRRRPFRRMTAETFRDIVDQLAEFRSTLEGVFLNGYNEPTIDSRLPDQVGQLHGRGLPVALLSNGSGLTPDFIDRVVDLGGLRYISINLPTLDPDDYARDQGVPNLDRVLRNMDYASAREPAREMVIAVLGCDDASHQRIVQAVRERFRGTPWIVKAFAVFDRAGLLPAGLKPNPAGKRLCGCDNVGSRPFQHVYITAEGKALLCCQDYDEGYIVGDLSRQTVREIMESEALARYRRWTYGLEEAPADYICLRCASALFR